MLLPETGLGDCSNSPRLDDTLEIFDRERGVRFQVIPKKTNSHKLSFEEAPLAENLEEVISATFSVRCEGHSQITKTLNQTENSRLVGVFEEKSR